MRILLLPIVMFLAAPARSQMVRGVVSDAQGRPVGSASVSLFRLNDSIPQKLALTNASGQFEIPFNGNDYVLCATHVGYARACSGTLAAGVREQNLTLQRKEETMQAVTVTGSRPPLEARADRLVVNVEGTINSVGSTALDILRRSPGVSVDNDDNISMTGKSGVQVFIDGRQSPLTGPELSAYLASLQSAQVEAIELITNPSARYEAAGNGGIINIRMKKNKALGTNGSVNVGYGIGSYAKYNAGFSINHRNRNFNVFGTYTWASAENLVSTDTYRLLGDSTFDQHFRRIITDKPHNVQFGVDYFASKKSTIGVLINALPGRQVIENGGTTEIGPASGAVTKYLEGQTENRIHRGNTGANLNYRYFTTAREANIDLDYTHYDSNSDQLQPNLYYDAGHNFIGSSAYHMIAPSDIHMWAARSSYDIEAGKGRVSFGGKLGKVTSDNSLQRYDVGAGGERLDSLRSNTFRYEEGISALFVRFQKEQKSLFWQMGLRMEHTRVDGRSTGFRGSGHLDTFDSSFTRTYTDVFPSASILLKGKNAQIGLAIGRRIDRPAYQDINPFEFKVDAYISRRGNTDLRPQYTDVVELTHVYRARLTTQLSYSHVRDAFTQIFDTTERSKSFITRTNVSSQHIINLSINYTLQGRHSSGFINVNPGYLRYRSNFGLDRDLDLEAFSFVVKAQWAYRFSHGWSAEIAGQYNDPGIALGFFKGGPNGNVDLAVSKTAFENRLIIKAAMSDIFFQTVNRGESFFAGQYMKVRRTFEPRLFRVNLSYRFGSNTVKAARNRKTLAEEEKARLQASN